MEQILNIIEQIAGTSSRNEKESILYQNKDNELLKQVLEYTMNPYKVFGIGSKAFKKVNVKNQESKFNNIIELLDYLLIHNTGTDKDKLEVNLFIAAQPEEHREWYKRIVLKDLKAGIQPKTVNKIYKNLIPEFSVALAEPFERLFNSVSIEPKLDGVRCIAVKQNGITNLFTRNGKAIEGFLSIVEQINELPEDNIVLDGEIMGKDYKDTMEKLFKKSGIKEADYNIFDYLPVEEFYNGQSKKPYQERRADLVSLAAHFGDRLKLVKVYEYIKDPTAEDILKWVSVAESEGYEGTMVKNCESVYKCKRTFDIQKCKTFFSDEYEIVGFEEGDGKYQGTLGKVIINVDNVTVSVGSGFTDAERNEIWNNKDKFLGMQIEVQYQEKIKKTGSLRFPTVKNLVVKSVRYDK